MVGQVEEIDARSPHLGNFHLVYKSAARRGVEVQTVYTVYTSYGRSVTVTVDKVGLKQPKTHGLLL